MAAVYTPEEAARYLKVHVNTVYKLLRSGHLPAAKLGRDWRIPSDVLDDYLHRRLQPATGAEAEDASTEDNDGFTTEDRTWMDGDTSRLGELEPYDWGPQGPPAGKPVRYVPGRGPIIEGEKIYG